jgi:uncharacterized membrane protein YcaP (DUF421 family)
MEAIVRATFIYLFLVLILRAAGKRQFAELTSFDLVLLLVIAEATQQGLLGQDFSVTYAALAIITLVGLDILFSLIKERSKLFEKVIDGMPTVLMDEGQLLRDRMRRVLVDEDDILAQARLSHGLERLDQVRYAILERDGKISIIPR